MVTTIALRQTERVLPNVASKKRVLPNRIGKSVFLEFIPHQNALWTFLEERASPCVTLELLEELSAIDQTVSTSAAFMGLQFRVLASRKLNIFSLGGDLALFRYYLDSGDRESLLAYGLSAVNAVWSNVVGCGQPGLTTIALVQGEAQGGGFEAALSCHVIVAEKGLHFGFPEPLFGMFPGMGGGPLLCCRTDPSIASKIISSTNRYPSELLFEMGIVDILAPQGQGQALVHSLLSDETERAKLAALKKRFNNLRREILLDLVHNWVDQAFNLSARQKRSMSYIIDAQKRLRSTEGEQPLGLQLSQAS